MVTRIPFPSSYQWSFESADKNLFLFEHPTTMSGFSEEKCFSRFERLSVARSPDGQPRSPDGQRFTRIHLNREIAAWCEENLRGTYMIRYGEPAHYEVGFDEEVDWLLFKFRWS